MWRSTNAKVLTTSMLRMILHFSWKTWAISRTNTHKYLIGVLEFVKVILLNEKDVCGKIRTCMKCLLVRKSLFSKVFHKTSNFGRCQTVCSFKQAQTLSMCQIRKKKWFALVVRGDPGTSVMEQKYFRNSFLSLQNVRFLSNSSNCSNFACTYCVQLDSHPPNRTEHLTLQKTAFGNLQ